MPQPEVVGFSDKKALMRGIDIGAGFRCQLPVRPDNGDNGAAWDLC
jgi:hypothetical protein